MLELSILGLFLPLVSALVLVTFSFSLGRRVAGLIASSSLLLSFSCFVYIFYGYAMDSLELGSLFLFHWIPVAGINANFTLYIDSLSLLMTLIVTGIAFLIHVYANGYMDHERDYARFFAALNFFVFAMLLLVLAQNLLLLFVGWEAVGLASYLLIGFWYEKPAAANAAMKAFVVNRIGDVGLLLGLLLTIYTFGTSDIPEVLRQAGTNFDLGAPVLVVLAILYFIGATGKSAQLPLHVWLADAMEGPTPVSALIHAATMVTAGVYLVVRLHPLYLMAPDVLYAIGTIGGITALFAAFCAIGQTELKRVLAYSTVSQLGLMFVACSVGSFYAAMFHLTTHAFVKALLFLSAGNVVHMLHGTTDMAKMGALAKKMPFTHMLFLIGVLALSGIPPLALFFSKDLIIEEAYHAGFYAFSCITLISSALTAFYLGRAYFLTFRGIANPKHLHKDVVEAPNIMLIPVAILGVLSVIGGFLGFSSKNMRMPLLESFLESSQVHLANDAHSGPFHLSMHMWLSIIAALGGLGLATLWYRKISRQRKLKPPALFNKAFYFNEIYASLIVAPLKNLSGFIRRVTEPYIFEAALIFSGRSVLSLAAFLQQLQNGQIRSYLAGFALGAAALLVYFIG